jgi:hypothetical protein
MIDRAVPGLPCSPRDQTALAAHMGTGQFHPCWNLLIGRIWAR